LRAEVGTKTLTQAHTFRLLLPSSSPHLKHLKRKKKKKREKKKKSIPPRM
jgi:hypothetical protein